MKDLLDYLPELFEALEAHLDEAKERWGDTWKKRSIKGQERRAFARFQDYYDQYVNGGVPMPWLKIIGIAFICWLREEKRGEVE